MNEKTIKITSIALQVFKVICFTLALVILLIPFTIYVEETVWAVPPGYSSRQEVTAETDYKFMNFFGYVEYLSWYGWSVGTEIIFIISVITNLVLAVAFVAIELVAFIKNYNIPKAIRIIMLAFSSLALLTFVLAIILQSDCNVWKMVDYEKIYLTGYSSWNIYSQTGVKGVLNLVVPIIFSMLGFLAHVGAGVMTLMMSMKKTPEIVTDNLVTDSGELNAFEEKIATSDELADVSGGDFND